MTMQKWRSSLSFENVSISYIFANNRLLTTFALPVARSLKLYIRDPKPLAALVCSSQLKSG